MQTGGVKLSYTDRPQHPEGLPRYKGSLESERPQADKGGTP